MHVRYAPSTRVVRVPWFKYERRDNNDNASNPVLDAHNTLRDTWKFTSPVSSNINKDKEIEIIQEKDDCWQLVNFVLVLICGYPCGTSPLARPE
jgi:hypothetical protein